MNRWYKGNYSPKNPNKYKGDINKIVYRSSWEQTFMRWADLTPEVLAWSSETVQIPYMDPVAGRQRKYVVDFRIVTKQADGSVKVTLVEIKPYKQTQKPKSGRKSSKTILTEQTTWLTNMAKWEAARKFCKALGWNFVIFTEVELFGGIDRGFKPPAKPAR